MKKKYDWKQLQEDYDNGLTQRDLIGKYGVSVSALDKAGKRGDIIFRSRAEALHLASVKKPRILSEETKQKISNSRKEYLQKHPDKVPYRLNHYSKGPSYPELYFRELFQKEQIELETEVPYTIYQLDFANKEKKIDIEIDGDQHYLDKRIIESDKRRNEILEKDGWIVFRIKWSEYQKSSYEGKEKIVEIIKNLLS
jgi:very-short-patch-repair endonuclease